MSTKDDTGTDRDADASADTDTDSMNDAETTDDGTGTDGETYRREPARRAFAAELNDATHVFRESDEERAPKYALLPTGEKANRVLHIGTLLDVDRVGSGETIKARIVDSSGDPETGNGAATLYVYAGQYEPEAASALEALEPPAYVAVVGKPDTFENDEGEPLATIRPESIAEVDADERDTWVLAAAERTLDRLDRRERGENEYAEMAADIYGADADRYAEGVRLALTSLADG